MKSIILLLLFIGIISIVIGYVRTYQRCDNKSIEYRYIPRTFFEEQIGPTDLKKSFSSMFNDNSSWISYPFNSNDGKNSYNKINYNNFIE